MSEEVIKTIEEKIEGLYDSLMEKPLQVLNIFNDFFGEDKVDMQGYPTLDEFKTWINTAPIYSYIPREIVNMDSGDQRRCSVKSIPEDIVGPVINSFSESRVISSVGSLKFNTIFILIHFPHVRVTNEHDRFVDINNLWAKIHINYNGSMSGGLTLNRSEYTLLHIVSNYMHSHISRIPFYDFTEFQSPCTGSGPINGTISALNREYDEDTWNMFCLELSKYVTVESTAGGPYHYLERLGTSYMTEEISRFTACLSPAYYRAVLSYADFRRFVEYFVKSKKLKFNYVNGSFSIGMSLVEFIVLISNEFIKWYNEQFNEGIIIHSLNVLKNSKILTECIIDNGKIYSERVSTDTNNYAQYIGKKVCIFKGKEITVDITDISEIRNSNKSLILNTQTALYILTVVLKVLNYRYGRNKAIYKGNQLSTEVRYL